MVFYLQPVFTFIWSFVLLGEQLTLNLVIGSILILVGASIVSKKEANINVKKVDILSD